MKNRTIRKEPVSIGKMDRCHFPVNQHFVTNRYKNGPFDRGFWNPSYKMLGERERERERERVWNVQVVVWRWRPKHVRRACGGEPS